VGGLNASTRRNALQGLTGFALPAVIMLVSYPVLVRHLGAEAFGIYLLAASLGGAALLLDVGFSAATLKFVAEDLAAERRQAAAEVIVTSVACYGLLGALAGIVWAALAPWSVSLLKTDPALTSEAIRAFRLGGLQLAAFLPMTVFLAVAKGMQQFGRSTAILLLLSLATYGGAVAAVVAGAGLAGAMTATVLANFVVLAFAAGEGIRLCRERGIGLGTAAPRWAAVRRMSSFGWAVTVNSLSGFLLYHVQKYLVGAAIGPGAVTIYQMAAVGPSKIHAAVNAATEVMFPLASAARDLSQLRRTYRRMLVASLVIAAAGFGPLAMFARPALDLWVGAKLAGPVAPLVPVLALGYLFLALSPAPFHLLNGLGRPGFNTAFYGLNALINITLIAVFSQRVITLQKFAWAFACANIVTSLIYQGTVERLVWRRPRLAEAAL
jgi:O-antigen/teichoic acid export membrane protein